MSRGRKIFFVLLIVTLFSVLLAEVNYLAVKANFRWDATKAKQHTLTPATRGILRSLQQDARFTAFYVGIPPKYLEDLFGEYERLSAGKIQTEIFDPLVQIGYAAQFGNIISGQESKVVVQAGAERKDIDFSDGTLTENQLTNALVQVTRPAQHVYFLIGHGERELFSKKAEGLASLAKLLLANNVMPKELMLEVSKGIPQDCDLLVIAGPKNALTDRDVPLIRDYLEKGGDALFLVEHVIVTTPDIPLAEDQLKKNPSLNEILEAWGVRVADDVVVDLASHAGEDVGSPATRNYMPYRAITEGLDYTFYLRPRSIEMVKDRRASIQLLPLVSTASDEMSWGETNRMLQVKFDEGVDRAGPVPIAYIVWEPRGQEETEESAKAKQASEDEPAEPSFSWTRLAVFTDADFLSNAYLGHYSNAQMGLNVISWLTDMDKQIFIDPKALSVERLDMTSRQKRAAAVILLAMPLLIAAAGVGVWLGRR